MSLEEKILNDYKEAMKAKDSLKSSVLSFLRADMMNLAIAKKKSKLDDSEAVSVIKKQMIWVPIKLPEIIHIVKL